MDLISTKWLSDEMEMNDSVFNHEWQQMSSLDNESIDFNPFSSSHNITTYDYNQDNTNNYVSQLNKKSSSNNSSSSCTIISFGNSESPNTESNNKALERKKSFSNMENICAPLEYGEMKRGVSRTPEQAQDHVLAERKRREKMTQKFVVLSTLVPGLKKLDKATVLGDAINYIKELQGHIKELEVQVKGDEKEEAMKIRSVKGPRHISSYDSEAFSYDEKNDGNCISSVLCGGLSSDDEISPEIEVRASQGNLMIRVYCKNQTGVTKEVMGEIEKHHLSLISCNIMPFGLNGLHMTIIAQMDVECELTANDLADNIRRSIIHLV